MTARRGAKRLLWTEDQHSRTQLEDDNSLLCSLIYTLSLSRSHKHNVRQAESEAKELPAQSKSNVCSTVFSSKANWESPVKLLELFPNANMCYQINKATKDANREIRAARLASVGRKKKK